MKKIINIMAILVVISSLFTVGCNKKNNVKKHNIDSNDINITSLEQNGTLVDTKTYNSRSDDKTTLVVFKRYTNKEETYAIIKGYEENDKVVWTYTTSKVKEETESPFELLGGEEEKVLVKENDDLVILNANDGKPVAKVENLGDSLVYIGKVNNIIPESENNKEYLFIGKLDTEIDKGMTNIIAIDYNTYKVEKNVKLPDDYAIYEYKMKTIEGAPNDIYLEFTKYTAVVDADNVTGFMASDIFKDNFNPKEIVINYE